MYEGSPRQLQNKIAIAETKRTHKIQRLLAPSLRSIVVDRGHGSLKKEPAVLKRALTTELQGIISAKWLID
jgi:hypothetical protein